MQELQDLFQNSQCNPEMIECEYQNLKAAERSNWNKENTEKLYHVYRQVPWPGHGDHAWSIHPPAKGGRWEKIVNFTHQYELTQLWYQPSSSLYHAAFDFKRPQVSSQLNIWNFYVNKKWFRTTTEMKDFEPKKQKKQTN